MNLNKVIIAGRLTETPELRMTTSNVGVCSFSVATNNVYKKNGEKIEEVDYHNCVAWQRLAEIICEYMVKGQQILIQGRLKTRKWEKDGQNHYKTEIIISEMEMGMKPRGSETSQSVQNSDESIPTVGEEKKSEDIKIEDIPF